MNWRGKQVLVTGSCGFIGSHLVERLVKLGAEVRAFVYYNSFNNWGWIDTLTSAVKQSIEIVTGDIRDAHGVRKAVRGQEIIFHLASLIAIPYSYRSPESYVSTNIMGTLNVLQACLEENNVSKIIHTSTSEVYGTAQYVPIDEKHPLQAQSPYSATKIGADMLAWSFYCSFGLPVTICRPFNTYGPRQSARAVIPTIILQILANKPKIRLGSIHPSRDFNYVEDIVNGFVRIAEIPNSVGEVINIGSNREVSIAQVVEHIKNIMEAEVEVELDAQRVRPPKSEVQRLWANNQKACQLLGWKPEYTLDEGLRKTIDWITNNRQYYKLDIYNV